MITLYSLSRVRRVSLLLGALLCLGAAGLVRLSCVTAVAPEQPSVVVPKPCPVCGAADSAKPAVLLTRNAPRLVLQIGHREPLESLAFSPDARVLASAAFDGLKIWDVRSGDLKYAIPSPKTPFDDSGGVLAFRQDGRRLLYAGKFYDNNPTFHGQRVYEFDVPTGRLLQTLDATILSRDGRALLSHRANSVSVTSARTGQYLGSLPASAVTAALDFSRDGAFAAEDQNQNSADDNSRKMRIWNVRQGKLVCTLSDRSGVCGPAAFSPDGKLIVTSGEDPLWKGPTGPGPFTEASYAHTLALKVWDAHTGRLLHVWRGHEQPSQLVFLPRGRSLLVDGQVWDSETGRLTMSVEYRKKYPNLPVPQIITPYPPFAVAGDGKLLASSDGGQRGIHFWNLGTGGFQGSLAGTPVSAKLLQFSPDGHWLVAAGGPPCLWDMKIGRLARQLAGMDNVDSVNFLPNGLVGAGNLQESTIWDAATGKVVTVPQSAPPNHSLSGYSDGVAVSPSGEMFVTLGVASVGQPKPLEIQSVVTRQVQRTLPDFQGSYLVSAVFTPDGFGIANGGAAGVTLWNLQTGAVSQTFHALASQGARPLAFSGNGAVLAGQAGSNKVLLWNVNTGVVIAALDTDCRDAALSPSGDELFLSDTDWLKQYPVAAQNPSPQVEWTIPLAFEFDHAVAVSPNGCILAVSVAGAVKLYGTVSHRLLLTLMMFPATSDDGVSNSWIVYTPDGFYDGSADVAKFIRWRVGAKLFPATVYEKKFHWPDVILKALKTP